MFERFELCYWKTKYLLDIAYRKLTAHLIYYEYIIMY